jgi:hypothetical protein
MKVFYQSCRCVQKILVALVGQLAGDCEKEKQQEGEETIERGK